MLKKKILIIIILLLQINSFSLSAFCDIDQNESKSNPICSESPEKIDNYIEDMVYLISLIPSNKTEYKNIDWLWSKALDTVLWAVWISLVVFTDVWWEFFSNFFVIFKDQAIVRDWTKIVGLKWYISAKAIDNINEGSLNQKVKNIEQIRDFTKNSPNFFISLEWDSYKDLYRFLWRNQQIFERIFFSVVVRWEFPDDTLQYIEDNWSTSTINKEKILKMANYLETTYKNINCNTTWEDFIKKVKDIVCVYWKDKTQEAIDNINCNYDRLRKALYGEASDGKCGSIQLKPALSGNERIKLNWETDLKKWFWKVIKQFDELKNVKTKLNEYKSDIWQMFESQPIYQEKIPPKQEPTKVDKDLLISNLENASNIVIEDDDKIGKKLIEVDTSDFTHNITQQAVEVSKNIFEVSKLIDGAWIDYKESAAWKATDTCLNQSPFIWDCKNDN